MSINTSFTRSDAETEALVERHGLAEHLDALNEITQEIFGSSFWLSASQADDSGSLVMHVSVGEYAEPEKMVQLELEWYARAEPLIGERIFRLRLLTEYV